MKNHEVSRLFREIAAFLEMDGVAFKPRAYDRAAETIDALGEPIEDVYATGGKKALNAIPGIGKSFADKIAEYLETGSIEDHRALNEKTPVALEELLGVEGLGPKGIRTLYEHLGIRTLGDLEAAVRAEQIRQVPGFGAKMEEKLLQGIGFVRSAGGRLPIGQALPAARQIESRLREIPGVRQTAVAGSLRRRRETIGDLDLLVVADDPARVMEEFTSMDGVVAVHGHGPTKSSVRLEIGIDADLRVVPAESFGAALQYFTGSRDHGVACRKIAIEKGLKLNEYGVFRGEEPIAGRTEEEVYEALGLPWIPPELREDRGEIQASTTGRLPDLVELEDLRGDLQTQTDWSDGKHSIEEMARAAKDAGLEYMVVTDHTKSLAMMGQDEDAIAKQIEAIRALDAKLRGFQVLAGAEVNILRDGTLDIADETLARLDVVGVAVHSHFDLPRDEQTARICRALRNPHADILFHPTGRVVGKRPAYDVDIDEVIRVAVETGTALEIDAFPERLDLNEEHARKAVSAGAFLVIDSDAHSAGHFDVLEYGVGIARRAWVPKERVLNTLPAARLLERLKDGRGRTSPGRRKKK